MLLLASQEPEEILIGQNPSFLQKSATCPLLHQESTQQQQETCNLTQTCYTTRPKPRQPSYHTPTPVTVFFTGLMTDILRQLLHPLLQCLATVFQNFRTLSSSRGGTATAPPKPVPPTSTPRAPRTLSPPKLAPTALADMATFPRNRDTQVCPNTSPNSCVTEDKQMYIVRQHEKTTHDICTWEPHDVFPFESGMLWEKYIQTPGGRSFFKTWPGRHNVRTPTGVKIKKRLRPRAQTITAHLNRNFYHGHGCPLKVF